MTLATVGFRLCLGGEAAVGEVCEPPVMDARQIFEDWAGGGSKFGVVNNQGVIIDADGASFGGRYRVTPDPNRGGDARSIIKTTQCLDLTGLTIVARPEKPEPNPTYTGFIVETVANTGTREVYVEIIGRSGGGTDFDVAIYGTKNDTTDEYQRTAYNAENHRWWRIRHDEVTEIMDVSVSADCQEWDVLISATGSDESKFRAQHFLLVQEVQQGPSGGDAPGSWSEIYIYPTNPEPEEPEEE